MRSAAAFLENVYVPKHWRKNIFKRTKFNDVDGIIYDGDLTSVPDCSKNNSYIRHHLLPSMECNLYDQMLFLRFLPLSETIQARFKEEDIFRMQIDCQPQTKHQCPKHLSCFTSRSNSRSPLYAKLYVGLIKLMIQLMWVQRIMNTNSYVLRQISPAAIVNQLDLPLF